MSKKKSFNRQNGSGELDVFEAAKYFSGYNNEASSYNCATLISHNITRDERHQQREGGQISLDVPMRRNNNPHHQQQQQQQSDHTLFKKQVTKEKKHKQPSSPGGKLASFLNSLFNQTSSKKKKNSKPTTTQSMKDEEESSSGRRKRRVSISHFRSSNTVDTKSFYSSSTSGFRTPPPNYIADTPVKSYKVSDLLKNEKRNEDHKFIDGFLEKYKNKNGRVDPYQSEDKDFRKFSEVDDGADSDSSSDLFELRSFDLGSYSSGLPVYETTNINSFKRGAPITNGVL